MVVELDNGQVACERCWNEFDSNLEAVNHELKDSEHIRIIRSGNTKTLTGSYGGFVVGYLTKDGFQPTPDIAFSKDGAQGRAKLARILLEARGI